MASLSTDNFVTSLASMAAAGMQGRQMAQQENDQEQQERQRQAMQMIPILQSAQAARTNAATAPYEALSHVVPQMSPEAQSRFYSGYSAAATPSGPGINYQGLSGAFDADNPLRGVIAGMGGPPPATPTPPGWVQQPNGGFMPAPPAAPGFGGGVGPSGSPAATIPGGGGVTSPTAVPPGGAPVTVPAPGGPVGPGGKPLAMIQSPVGNFALGPDPKQIAGVRSEVARMAPRFGGKELPDEFRQQANSLIARANQQADSGDLEGARQTIAQLQGLEADIPRQGRAGAEGAAKFDATRYDRLTRQFQSKSSTPQGAYADVNQLWELEQQNVNRSKDHPELSVAGMDKLSSYDSEIQEMRGQHDEWAALRAKKDRTPAEEQRIKDLQKSWTGTAQGIADDLRYQLPAGARTAALGQVRGLLTLLPPDQRTPENVAAMIEARSPNDPGAKAIATLIRERGLNFGGAEAEKESVSLLKALPGIMRPGTPDQVRQAFVDKIGTESALTGHPIRLDPAQLNRPDVKDQPGTAPYQAAQDAHDKAILDIARLKAQNKVEIAGGAWRGAQLDIDLKQARLNQATGKIDPSLLRSAVIAGMRRGQHGVDQAYQDYSHYINDPHNQVDRSTFDPKDWTAKHGTGNFEGLAPEEKRGVALYQDWQAKVDAQGKLVDNIAATQRAAIKKAGGTSAGSPAAKAPLSAKPAAAPVKKAGSTTGGGRYSGLTTAELARRFAKAVAAQSGAP